MSAAEQPLDTLDHDVLLFPRPGVIESFEYNRFPVVKVNDPKGFKAGTFQDPPELCDPADPGQRKVLSVARPAAYGPPVARAFERGPAFATLPIKPEPSSTSVGTCYLINAEHFQNPNLWTAEEWSDAGLPDVPAPQHPAQMEVLIAAPWGKVFRLLIQNHEQWPSEPLELRHRREDLGEIELVNLQPEAEVWSQLRNGCVAGRVWFQQGGRVVPLVNVTPLQANQVVGSQASGGLK